MYVGLSQNKLFVQGDEGTCHPVQQCGPLMHFSFWTTMELYGTEE